MLDPFSVAIAAAVERAIEARMPAIIDAIKSANKVTAPPVFSDRFVPMTELVETLSCDRSTIHRRAVRGQYPPLRKQGGTAGYYRSDLEAIFAKPDRPGNQ